MKEYYEKCLKKAEIAERFVRSGVREAIRRMIAVDEIDTDGIIMLCEMIAEAKESTAHYAEKLEEYQ